MKTSLSPVRYLLAAGAGLLAGALLALSLPPSVETNTPPDATERFSPPPETAPNHVPPHPAPESLDPTSRDFVATLDRWLEAVCAQPDSAARTEALREILRCRATHDPLASLELARTLRARGFAVSVASPLVGWAGNDSDQALAWALRHADELRRLPAAEQRSVSHALQEGPLHAYSDRHLTSVLSEADRSIATRLVARWSNPAEREKIAQEIAAHPAAADLRRLVFQQLGHRASLDALGWLQPLALAAGEKQQIAAAFLRKAAAESSGAMSVAALRTTLTAGPTLSFDVALAAVATGIAPRDPGEALVFASAIQDPALKTSFAAKTALALSTLPAGDPEKILGLVSWPDGDRRTHDLYALVSTQLLASGRDPEKVRALITQSAKLSPADKQALLSRLDAQPRS